MSKRDKKPDYPDNDLYHELKRLLKSGPLLHLEDCFNKHIASLKERMLNSKTPDDVTLALKYTINEAGSMSPTRMCEVELRKIEAAVERVARESEGR